MDAMVNHGVHRERENRAPTGDALDDGMAGNMNHRDRANRAPTFDGYDDDILPTAIDCLSY
jgi:hypothetical protein